MNTFIRYALARAKALSDGREITGYVAIDEYAPRETFGNLLVSKSQLVKVDPMTVELFTGLRDALTSERIFEGDVIQLYSPIGNTICPAAKDATQDYIGEICMPLNMVKPGAHKRLYLYGLKGTEYGSTCEGIYQLSSQWDSLEWVKVGGRSDDKKFLINGKLVQVDSRVIDPEEMFDAHNLGRSSDMWLAYQDKEHKERPLFGTFKRRQHIIRRIFEFYNNRATSYAIELNDPDFESLRTGKWVEDYKMYMV